AWPVALSVVEIGRRLAIVRAVVCSSRYVGSACCMNARAPPPAQAAARSPDNHTPRGAPPLNLLANALHFLPVRVRAQHRDR
ncbi:hypothetical protein AAHH79_37055, partial [Burkholderia pseudomallei]